MKNFLQPNKFKIKIFAVIILLNIASVILVPVAYVYLTFPKNLILTTLKVPVVFGIDFIVDLIYFWLIACLISSLFSKRNKN